MRIYSQGYIALDQSRKVRDLFLGLEKAFPLGVLRDSLVLAAALWVSPTVRENKEKSGGVVSADQVHSCLSKWIKPQLKTCPLIISFGSVYVLQPRNFWEIK